MARIPAQGQGKDNPADPRTYLPLPDLALHVLLALAEGDLHGWGIIKRIGELTEGRTRPSSGSLYLSMVKLEERKLISDAPRRPDDADDPRRRYYTLTGVGRRVLEAETARLARLVGHARGLGVAGAPPGVEP
jgi:DNA-binding PadR family transcriptional regulator